MNQAGEVRIKGRLILREFHPDMRPQLFPGVAVGLIEGCEGTHKGVAGETRPVEIAERCGVRPGALPDPADGGRHAEVIGHEIGPGSVLNELELRGDENPVDSFSRSTGSTDPTNHGFPEEKSDHRGHQETSSGRRTAVWRSGDFEAVVNATAHRDYSISGSKIRFIMFDDRLENYSPGALPNTVTIDSMALHQLTRNELITSLLAEITVAETVGDVGRVRYVEERGDGVPIILKESKKHSGEKPNYRLINDSEPLVTILFHQDGTSG